MCAAKLVEPGSCRPTRFINRNNRFRSMEGLIPKLTHRTSNASLPVSALLWSSRVGYRRADVAEGVGSLRTMLPGTPFPAGAYAVWRWAQAKYFWGVWPASSRRRLIPVSWRPGLARFA